MHRHHTDELPQELNENLPQESPVKEIVTTPLALEYMEKGSCDERPTVAVIIPTLNEAENLPLVLPYLPMNWIDEVILVDGRSTDGTVEVAKELLPSITVIMEKRKGKGIAMRAGYEASTSDILVVMDADGSNDPREIPRFVTALLEGADFVKGSRFAPGGGTTDMPRFRKLGNGFFVLLSNLLFSTKFTDLCYGYHAFWRYCLDKIVLKDYSGFEIDTALYLQAARSKLRIVDVPSFEGYRFYGDGKLQTIPDGYRVLKTILAQWGNSVLGRDEADLPQGFRGIKYSRPGVFEETGGSKSGSLLTQRLMEFIQLLSIIIFSGEDKRSVMQRTLKMALEASGTDSGSLVLLDENGNVSEGCIISSNEYLETNQDSWCEIMDKGVAGWAIKNRQPVLVLDTQNDDRWLQRDWDRVHRSALALPLSVGGMVIGALTLVRPEANRFTEEDLKTIGQITLAGQGNGASEEVVEDVTQAREDDLAADLAADLPTA